MSQTASPDSVVSNSGLWTPTGAASLWEALDEATPSDTDYITSPNSPVNASMEVGLSNVLDPSSSTGHVVSYRFRSTAGTSSVIVELVEGVFTRAARTVTSNPISFTTGSFTLTQTEADSIVNYSDLRIRLTATATVAQSVTFTDNFNRPDQPLGNGWTSVPGNPASPNPINILNNRASVVNPFNGTYAVRDLGSANGTISILRPGPGAGCGVVMRFIDKDNHIFFAGNQLVRRETGSDQIHASGFNAATPHTYTVTLDGNQITITPGRSTASETFTENFNVTGTTHGFLTGHPDEPVDDFVFVGA